jgi:hypothetical protein
MKRFVQKKKLGHSTVCLNKIRIAYKKNKEVQISESFLHVAGLRFLCIKLKHYDRTSWKSC